MKNIFKSAATAAALVAAPLPVAADDNWNITSTLGLDAHMRPGDTDQQGDHKQASTVLRDPHGNVFGLTTGIYTPQRDALGDQFDTATGTFTYGIETPYIPGTNQYGTYITGGLANGFVLENWQDTVAFIHGGHARTSTATTDGLYPILSLGARVDREFNLADYGAATLDLNTAAYGIMGTDRVALGGAAYISLNFGDGDAFRPDLSGLPVMPISHDFSLYTGLNLEARAYNLPTDRMGTETLNPSAVLGAAFTKENLSFGAEYRQSLTPEIRGTDEKPVGTFIFKMGLKF